jgi:hypothetical protein
MTAICAAGIPSDGDSGPPGGRLLRCCWSALLVRWFGNGAGDVASAAGGAEAAPGPGVEYVGYSVTVNDNEIGPHVVDLAGSCLEGPARWESARPEAVMDTARWFLARVDRHGAAGMARILVVFGRSGGVRDRLGPAIAGGTSSYGLVRCRAPGTPRQYPNTR